MRRVFEHNVKYTGLASDPIPSRATLIKAESVERDSWTVLAVKFPPNPLSATSSGVMYPGALFHVSFAFAIEGKSNDPWFGRQRVRNAPSAHELVHLLATARILHENPLHVADMKRWYNSAMPYLKLAAPTLLALLDGFLPGASKIAGPLVGLVPDAL